MPQLVHLVILSELFNIYNLLDIIGHLQCLETIGLPCYHIDEDVIE
jgi:hypothetical protein